MVAGGRKLQAATSSEYYPTKRGHRISFLRRLEIPTREGKLSGVSRLERSQQSGDRQIESESTVRAILAGTWTSLGRDRRNVGRTFDLYRSQGSYFGSGFAGNESFRYIQETNRRQPCGGKTVLCSQGDSRLEQSLLPICESARTSLFHNKAQRRFQPSCLPLLSECR